LLAIKSTDFDLPTIVSKQDYLIKKYTKKLQKLRWGKEEKDYDKHERD